MFNNTLLNYAMGGCLIIIALVILLGCAWLMASLGAARDHQKL